MRTRMFIERVNRWAVFRSPVVSQLAVIAVTIVGGSSLAQPVSFIVRRDFPVGMQPYGVALGDFNSDGVPDAAVVNFNSNNVSILLGNGDGTFRLVRALPSLHWATSTAMGLSISP